MKQIVFGSANHWTSPYQVGSHAWARLFANHQWKVSYISDPITPWHWMERKNRTRLMERYDLWRNKNNTAENGAVTSWVPFSLLAPQNKPFFRSKWVLDTWHHACMPSIDSFLERSDSTKPDVIWLDSVRHGGWTKSVKTKMTVVRVADWTAGFPNTPSSVLDLEREVVQRADLVITSAASLSERIKSWRDGKPLITIRNGVDVAFWKEPSDLPVEYQTIPSPRAVYVGALDEWFDFDLLIQLARALPKLSFVIIGQLKKDLNDQKIPSNLYFLGVKPRNQARAYVQHADVGVIPFKRNSLIECVCPLKLYEYMTCGLPVVSTRWEELELMDSPALLAGSSDEWTRILSEITSGNHSDAGSNSPKKLSLDESGITKLKEYASMNDWCHRWLQWEEAYSTISKL
jgi:glycosyltransferase involved in cell wall biosynthesis